MNYANIKYCDIANGPGVRTSLFVSGCTHRAPAASTKCLGFCLRRTLHQGGAQPDLRLLRPRLHRRAVPAGGRADGAGQPAGAAALRAQLQGAVPRQDGVVLLGYTFEQLLGQEPSRCRCEATDPPLLALLDVLVDGPFIQAQYDISLRFRGSANQRLLDMPAPSPKASPSSGRTSPSFPPTRWTDRSCHPLLTGTELCQT